MTKVTMYPNRVEQPNRNEPSGLQGKCLKAVQRNGETYNVSCSYQQDPKYHHEWSNAEEIFNGNTIQCGRPNTRHCSHKTYYGIAGYRNTCPIAGISGTYTQPATLRVFFDLERKGILPSAKINKVEISFEHRCTGVDVANGRETTVWGPNFNGFNIYPNHKPLKIKLGSQVQDYNSNPPLSWNFSNTGTFTFYNISYNDLVNGIDIIYGNNLETNPGNIYIRNLSVSVDFLNGDPYIEGKQNSKNLSVSEMPECRSTIFFKLEAGYKQGSKKLSIADSPKVLQKKIIAITENKNLITVSYVYNSDQKTVIATLSDKTNIGGEKKVTFKIDGTNESISFTYNAIKRVKPQITIPNKIEKNVINNKITSIVANQGCSSIIEAYDEDTNHLLYTFENLDKFNKENIIRQEDIDAFYIKLAKLNCGFHTIYFRRNNEPSEDMISRVIEIVPTTYKFEVIEQEGNIPIKSYETIQNKTKNKSLILKYIKTKTLIDNPSFLIKNSTHGKEENNKPTKEVIGNIEWNNVNKEGASLPLTIGTYYPGNYEIKVKDKDVYCKKEQDILKVKIDGHHKQHHDEIIVRGEDSTAFDYDYLVALEGDTVTDPLYVETFSLGASYNDIKICAKKENIIGVSSVQSTKITIKNTSQNIIQNLFLELNPLIKNDDNLFEVTSNEWLESDGIFYNFKENFDRLNRDYKDIVNIKNLTVDNDNIDEEDVYIHILQLNPQEEIELEIPFGSGREKEVYLEILLFGNVVPLYLLGYCNDTKKIFNKIKFKVYDSVLTDMEITGDTDLFITSIDGKCPKECFETTKGITYSIKNIDTNRLNNLPDTIIENDPRLLPYKIKYNNKTYDLKQKIYEDPETHEKYITGISIDTTDSNIKTKVLISRDEKNATRTAPIIGARIDVYTKFEEYEEVNIHQYTNYDGETEFFIQIPKTFSGEYTIDDLLQYISIEYAGNLFFNGTKYSLQGYPGTNRRYTNYTTKERTKITVIKNQIKYRPGQVIPLKVRIEGITRYIQNEITFRPQILEPGISDSLTVYYKICNLDENKGKFNTTFKTNTYTLVPNEITKTIYCGYNTNLILNSKLVKIVLENKTLNRLYISLNNQDRDNKKITLLITEFFNNEKYDILNYKIDKGELYIEPEKDELGNIIYNKNKDGSLIYKKEKDKDGNIIEKPIPKTQIRWEIDYLNEDEIIRGYIDLESKRTGFSKLKLDLKDFIDKMGNISFGEDSYKCDCRRRKK